MDCENGTNHSGKNCIIGVLGRKGSGKTVLAKKIIKTLKRVIIIDPLGEYTKGVVCDTVDEFIQAYRIVRDAKKWCIIFRPKGDEDGETVLELCYSIRDYWLVLEEADFYASGNSLNKNVRYIMTYGRHYGISTLWITQRPYSVSPFLRSQSDILITFKMHEPRDIAYLKDIPFDKEITTLTQYEYSTYVSGAGISSPV